MSAKAIFNAIKVLGAISAILYCGRLLYYFIDTSGSLQNAKDIGLGPTILGLTVVGLLSCLLLAFRLVRLFSGPRSSGSDNPDKTDPSTGEREFDADAVVARYVAQRAAEANVAATPVAPGGAAKRQGFGRKIK